MRRAVQRLLENPLSECLLDGFAMEGDEVTVSMEDGSGGGSVSGSGMWGGEGIMLTNTRGGQRRFTLEVGTG